MTFACALPAKRGRHSPVLANRGITPCAGALPLPGCRLFLSAEPPPSLERPLPPSLLQSCVKLTNEPPQGLRANLARAWAQFDDDALDGCARQAEFRTLAFALCFFHAVLLERKKFGVGNLPGARSGAGWNMGYPFNAGDLRCCAQLAANYLDAAPKVSPGPWSQGPFPLRCHHQPLLLSAAPGGAPLLFYGLPDRPTLLPVRGPAPGLHLLAITHSSVPELVNRFECVLDGTFASPPPCPLKPPSPEPKPLLPRLTSLQIPWDDLRYMVGEIMYGGHVVEGWDRRLVAAYLETLLHPGLLDPRAQLCPGFAPPPPTYSHAQVREHAHAQPARACTWPKIG